MQNDSEWQTLLHYRGHQSLINKKSNYFISSVGYKNPQAEYNALIYQLFIEQHIRSSTLDLNTNISRNDNNSVVCRFPLRIQYILKHTPAPYKQILHNLIDERNCIEYKEFMQNMPFEKIFLNFASESESAPGSSLGHIFFRFTTKDLIQSDTPKTTKVLNKDFTISFFVRDNELGFNPITYIALFTSGAKGDYEIKPLEYLQDDYIQNQNRSVYSFRVKLNEKEVSRFQQHIWELKGKEINYSFMSYNCNDAVRSALGAINPEFLLQNWKLFQTPTEYLHLLQSKNLIELTETHHPKNKIKFIEKYGANDVTQNKNNTRIALFYGNFISPYVRTDTPSFHHLKLEITPIYSDLRNVNVAYKDYTEAKLMNMKVGFDFYRNMPYIENIELLKTQSIMDFPRTKIFSKYMRIAFETNLYQHGANNTFLAQPNSNSYIFPTIEVGFGIGAYAGAFGFYTVPKLFYRYDIINNVAIGFETGFISSFSLGNVPFKWILNYNYYYDFFGNNRGYDSKLYHYMGIGITKDIDMFIETIGYHNLLNSRSIFYQSNAMWQNNIGFSFYF
ncbi:lipoprotein N-acyltransferase Lnb domain-containing protein [Helicobacter didelphidarum]|uniref:lipoprotein N-acyltransferase Lnb domain-containing protein n=1 Tax=Helicobacter didelphidarum TaxID=2040648 RepID=UPI0015F15D4A|nr:DUF4105 domain-containing protein [Helicobacter didelphidarum]